jgi:hypothetical protein
MLNGYLVNREGTDALLIRSDQLRALSNHRRQEYTKRLARFLSEHYPTHSSMEISGCVHHALASLERYGLKSERAGTVLAELMLTYGVDVEVREQWARYILSHTDLEETEKIARLESYLGVPSK